MAGKSSNNTAEDRTGSTRPMSPYVRAFFQGPSPISSTVTVTEARGNSNPSSDLVAIKAQARDFINLDTVDFAGEIPKLQRQHQQYDPQSFIDTMAVPFNVPMDPNNSKKKAGAEGHRPHCKACTDFKTWMELTANPRRHMSAQEREEKECPLDSSLLGRNTWSFLHTMAAYYPEKPSADQQNNMTKFIGLFAKFYPCQKCASHMREDLKENTPDTSSNEKLSQWFCELHNRVNVRLGKVEFDCSKVLERWRDGWADGSCD